MENETILTIQKFLVSKGNAYVIKEHDGKMWHDYATRHHPKLKGASIPTMFESGQTKIVATGEVYTFETWYVPNDSKDVFMQIFAEWEAEKATLPFVSYYYAKLLIGASKTVSKLFADILARDFAVSMLLDEEQVEEYQKGINLLAKDVRGELFDE